jgi:hypothetical protein
MRMQLEALVGQEVCICTVRTDDITTDHNGYYVGTLRRLGESAMELRLRDGNISYVAFRHVVRFYPLS